MEDVILEVGLQTRMSDSKIWKVTAQAVHSETGAVFESYARLVRPPGAGTIDHCHSFDKEGISSDMINRNGVELKEAYQRILELKKRWNTPPAGIRWQKHKQKKHFVSQLESEYPGILGSDA
ncbi:MAG: hypothetical protein CMP10_09750 [Zetaproteobacteria bacterium]|nr:hypothetical protein [Pseudobdellovibrionaceae bacterium]